MRHLATHEREVHLCADRAERVVWRDAASELEAEDKEGTLALLLAHHGINKLRRPGSEEGDNP